MGISLTRTDVHVELLNEIVKAGLFGVRELELPTVGSPPVTHDDWKPSTDRETLYARLIESLIEQAREEGIVVREGGGERITEVFCTEQDPELCPGCWEFVTECSCPCDQLDSGCTCESCSQQIADAIGMSLEDARDAR